MEKQKNEFKEFGSSAISSASYDREKQTLTINFTDGGIKSYLKVPETMWNKLKEAPSTGAFFNYHIRDNFKTS